MKTEIIGDKNVFAIEYKIEAIQLETVYGGCRVWLLGKYLGDIYDFVFLNMFAKTLIKIGEISKNSVEKNIDKIPYAPTSSKELINLFNEEIGLNTLVEENFDKFYHFSLRNDKSLIFYWCLDPNIINNIKDYPRFKDYPKEVQMAEISISTIREVADKFEARINEIIDESAMN